MASSLGRADARVIEVDHPLGGTDTDTVQRWADAAVETALQLLTDH